MNDLAAQLQAIAMLGFGTQQDREVIMRAAKRLEELEQKDKGKPKPRHISHWMDY